MDREATDSGTVQHWVNHRRRRCRRRGYGTSVDSFDDIIADCHFFLYRRTLWRKPRDRRTRKCRCCRNCCQSDGPEISAVISVCRVVLLPYISTPTTDCVCVWPYSSECRSFFFLKKLFVSSHLPPSSCYGAGNLENKNDNDSYWWARTS